jgi:hypothetical protein
MIRSVLALSLCAALSASSLAVAAPVGVQDQTPAARTCSGNAHASRMDRQRRMDRAHAALCH